MPATYNSSRKQTGVAVPQGLGEVTVVGTIQVTSALANLDVLNLCDVPAGAVITNIDLFFTDMDTNVSPTLAWDVGDTGDADRYIVAQLGGTASTTIHLGLKDFRVPAISSSLVATGFGYVYTAASTITATANTGPATGATGTVSFKVSYTMNEPDTVA